MLVPKMQRRDHEGILTLIDFQTLLVTLLYYTYVLYILCHCDAILYQLCCK